MKVLAPPPGAGEVLDWLTEHHPELAATAERDRNWLWLAENLSGDSNRELREELKSFGFRWAKNGHPLPSGATGTWAHHGTHPVPFTRRRGRDQRGAGARDGAVDWHRIAADAGLTVEQLRAAIL